MLRDSTATCQPVLNEIAQLQAILDTELSVGVVGVLVDGLGSDEEPLGDSLWLKPTSRCRRARVGHRELGHEDPRK